MVTTICGAGPVRLAGAIQLVTRHSAREIAVHLIARNDGSTPARVLSATCGFSVRLYRTVTEIEQGAVPVWENRLRTIRYGPEPAQVAIEECDLGALTLDLAPGETRSRVATHVSVDRIMREVPRDKYIVALGYRRARDAPVLLLCAGCLTRGSRLALSMKAPDCTEWSAKEIQDVLATADTRSERRRAEAPGPDASWFEFQVDTLARLIDSSNSVQAVPYPPELRIAGVIDTVLVRYVVDAAGHVAPKTLRVLYAHYQASADAVQAAVRSWRYHPAIKDGRRVRQVVQVKVAVIPRGIGF